MNAEKNNCLSVVKGNPPVSRNNFGNFCAKIDDTQAYLDSLYAKLLNIHHVKSNGNDYENRGGK